MDEALLAAVSSVGCPMVICLFVLHRTNTALDRLADAIHQLELSLAKSDTRYSTQSH